MSNNLTLTETQTKILMHAASQPQRAVLPLPADCRLVGGARQKVLIALQNKGMVEQVGRTANKRFLRISKLGMTAIGAGAVDKAASDAAGPHYPGGKMGLVVKAISSPEGTDLAALVELTKWLPHTIRAALSRLRQRGCAVQLTEIDGQKCYRLTEAAHVDA